MDSSFRRTSFMVAPLSCALTVAAAALAGPPAAKTTAAPSNTGPDPALAALEKLRLSIQRVTLDNGLQVVLNVDDSSPTIAVSVTYKVGSRNEQPKRSGFAHLFEHIMFEGSAHVKKGEHFTLVTARGGSLNGSTSENETNYFEVLPANELGLALWLEADRMKWLAVTPENFENQRKVVEEEYQMRVGNAAYAQGHIRLNALVYQGYFPYEHPPIGSIEDLDAAQFDWVKAFHDTYYAPNNAVLTIAGAFDADAAMELVRQYFGDAKPRRDIPAYVAGSIPPQTAERRETEQDPHAKTPALLYGWLIPAPHTPEHYALEIAESILTDGESARLYQTLVRQRSVARNVSGWTNDNPAPDALEFIFQLTEKSDEKAVERIIDQEIVRLAQTGPSADELERAKNRLRSGFIFSIQSNQTRSNWLGQYEARWGDARLLTRELDGYLKVTADDVKRAVAQHMTAARRSVVLVVPKTTTPQAKSNTSAAPSAAPAKAPSPAKAATPAKAGTPAKTGNGAGK